MVVAMPFAVLDLRLCAKASNWDTALVHIPTEVSLECGELESRGLMDGNEMRRVFDNVWKAGDLGHRFDILYVFLELDTEAIGDWCKMRDQVTLVRYLSLRDAALAGARSFGRAIRWLES